MDIKRKKLDISLQPTILPEEKSDVSHTKGQQQVKSKISKLVHIKKEKSRNAARTRRGKENHEFYELARLLPISSDTSSQLDKASIVRLTMCHLQLQNYLHSNFKIESAKQPNTADKSLSYQHSCSETQVSQYFVNNLGCLILQSLDGFLFVLNQEGRFLYISNTVTIYLGLAQVDLIGTSIYNYIHPSDHDEVKDYLSNKHCHVFNPPNNKNNEAKVDSKEKFNECSFFVRMRSTLSRRGLGVKTSGYKVVHITGKNCSTISNRERCSVNSDTVSAKGFIGIGHIMPPPSLTDVQSDAPLFIARLNPSLTVNYCEERVKALTSYDANEVKGHSLYQFVHSLDIHKISLCHKEALAKGQVVTPYYRWVLKNGSFVWMQSYATLLIDRHQTGMEDTFVWINYLLGPEPDLFSSFLGTTESKKTSTSKTSVASGTVSQLKIEEVLVVGKHAQTSEPGQKQKTKKVEKQNTQQNIKPGYSIKSTESVFNNKQVDEQPDKKNCDTSSSGSNNGQRKKLHITPTSGLPKSTDNILDHHSKIWLNPPNKEVSNHSDLPPGVELSKCHTTNSMLCPQNNPSVIHHHYPLGINPNLLHANPVLAKMLAPSFVPETCITQNNAIIFTTPVVNIMPPVFAPIPTHAGILPSTNKVNCCPTAIANILEELRKDPMRKVNPPNKVVLPNIQATQNIGSAGELVNASSVDGATDRSIPPQNIAPFSLQYCANDEFILGNIHTPFVLQPISISRKFNSFPA